MVPWLLHCAVIRGGVAVVCGFSALAGGHDAARAERRRTLFVVDGAARGGARDLLQSRRRYRVVTGPRPGTRHAQSVTAV